MKTDSGTWSTSFIGLAVLGSLSHLVSRLRYIYIYTCRGPQPPPWSESQKSFRTSIEHSHWCTQAKSQFIYHPRTRRREGLLSSGPREKRTIRHSPRRLPSAEGAAYPAPRPG